MIDGITVTQEVAANAVFAVLPPQVTLRMQARYPFYVWKEATGEVRLMCSWDTTEGDVDGFGRPGSRRSTGHRRRAPDRVR